MDIVISEKAMAISAMDTARFFLALSEPEEGDAISNMKLQKLLYYAQGFNLALHGKPLFPESVEAWMHGPVVPNVYHSFKECGGDPIPAVRDLDLDRYDEVTKTLLMDVYQSYGQFSAWKLREMTHGEAPWKNTPVGETITLEAMRDYFLTQIEG